MTKVDQLMKNTYRRELIEQHRLPQHFQRCVTLSTKIPMAVVTRREGEDSAPQMYELINEYLGGEYHIWELLEEPMTVTALVEKLTAEYDVTAEACRSDIEPFLNKLLTQNLLVTE